MDERDLDDAMKALAGAIVGAPAVEEWTPQTAFEQIDSCNFECEAGPLSNNVAYRWLKGRK